MKKIFCSSKNLENFTRVLVQRAPFIPSEYKIEKIPIQSIIPHWTHKPQEELRIEYLETTLNLIKQSINQGFDVRFAFEDNLDFTPSEILELSDGCPVYDFSNGGTTNFNQTILSIGKKTEALNCINSYITCLNGYTDADKTLPASDSLIVNYTEVYKKILKRNFDIKDIEFDNQELWDLDATILDSYKAFLI